jgi:hypothetical protein
MHLLAFENPLAWSSSRSGFFLETEGDKYYLWRHHRRQKTQFIVIKFLFSAVAVIMWQSQCPSGMLRSGTGMQQRPCCNSRNPHGGRRVTAGSGLPKREVVEGHYCFLEAW